MNFFQTYFDRIYSNSYTQQQKQRKAILLACAYVNKFTKNSNPLSTFNKKRKRKEIYS